MPSPLYLEPHFSADELKARYRASRDPVESRRWHLLWLVHTQTMLTDAAKAVGLNYDYARGVVKVSDVCYGNRHIGWYIIQDNKDTSTSETNAETLQ